MLCIIPFYTPLSKEREKEIRKVLDLNVKNNFIEKLYLRLMMIHLKMKRFLMPKYRLLSTIGAQHTKIGLLNAKNIRTNINFYYV